MSWLMNLFGKKEGEEEPGLLFVIFVVFVVFVCCYCIVIVIVVGLLLYCIRFYPYFIAFFNINLS